MKRNCSVVGDMRLKSYIHQSIEQHRLDRFRFGPQGDVQTGTNLACRFLISASQNVRVRAVKESLLCISSVSIAVAIAFFRAIRTICFHNVSIIPIGHCRKSRSTQVTSTPVVIRLAMLWSIYWVHLHNYITILFVPNHPSDGLLCAFVGRCLTTSSDNLVNALMQGSFTNWQHSAIIWKRISVKLGAVDLRSIRSSSVMATGVVIVVNLNYQAASIAAGP